MTVKALNWYGWSNILSGYGIVNLEYATALERAGIDISYGWEREDNLEPDKYKLLSREQKKLLSKPFVLQDIGIIKTTPQEFSHNVSKYRIGYTMVENTKIGEHWRDLCNEMDAIFVPSEYLIDVFKEGGITKPIVSVKQGVDIRKFKYVKRKPKETFVFGTIGYQDKRKNWEDLARAFCSEFAPDEPVELWIKNSNPYWMDVYFTDPRVKVINRMYSLEEIIRLYKLMDCFVFPSHAEGSGLPPREAMATGLPVIVTNWSGLTEVAKPDISYPLTPVSIDVPDVRGPEQPGFQARIDITELMFYMRYVYEHRDEGIKMGKRASDYIKKNYSWDACARDMIRKLEVL